jgi:hypothetical protein
MTTNNHYSKNEQIQPYGDLVAERCEPFAGDVQVDFILRHKVLKHSVKRAAEDVGISNSYGYKLNKLWNEDPKFRSRIMKKLDQYPDDYKDACKLLLPTILKTEVKGLQAMQDNPELALKHPQLLKQIKQAAGIDLNEIPPPANQVINIKTMNMVQKMIAEDLTGDEVIDVESEKATKTLVMKTKK